MYRINFVCLGNICRSPLAHAIMEDLVKKENLENKIKIESCGTASYHVGEPADQRMMQTARKNGIIINHPARALSRQDILDYDLLLAMDYSVYDAILLKAPPDADKKKIRLFREYDPVQGDLEVPDPYYGGQDGFNAVFEICMRTCRALLEKTTADFL
jgi:protein-tyrosine phosphatase